MAKKIKNYLDILKNNWSATKAAFAMKYKSMISINGTNRGKMRIPALKSGERLKRLPEGMRLIWRQNNWVGYCKLLTIDYCSSDVFFIHSNRFSNHHVVQCCTLVADGVSITPRLETKAVWRQHDCVSKKRNHAGTQRRGGIFGAPQQNADTRTVWWPLRLDAFNGAKSRFYFASSTRHHDSKPTTAKRRVQKDNNKKSASVYYGHMFPRLRGGARGSNWVRYNM